MSIFFMRVVIIFVLFHIPNVLLTNQRQRMNDDSAAAFWVDTILGILAACQALTTLYIIWLKDDVQAVVNNTWNKTFGRICTCCKCSSERRSQSDFSGSVQISGISGPTPTRNTGECADSCTIDQSKRKVGDSLIVEQLNNAWTNDEEQQLPKSQNSSEKAPVDNDQTMK